MVPDFRLATQHNRAALDAAMTLLLHLVNHWRRARLLNNGSAIRLSVIGELMKRLIGLAFVLAIPVALFADNTNDVNKELKALEGKWKAVAMEAGRNPFPKESVPDFTFIVAANGKAIGQSPQSEYQATITVDPKKSPRTIDNLHESGAQKRKKQYGIYKLEGDKWTVCMTRPGVAEGDRPKDFNSKDTANVVFVFERLKEDSKP
jgi:uncharacterized protein (TIGR03067 family)